MSNLVATIGDLDMDLFIKVPTMPGRDEKVTGERVSLAPGGMMANVAVGLQRLGTPSRLIAAVGDDLYGKQALVALAQAGVDTRYIQVLRQTDTFLCVILLTSTGEKSLVRIPSPAYQPDVASVNTESLDGVTHIHLTFGAPELARHVIGQARERGATVSLDLEAADIPDDRDLIKKVLSQLDLLFINQAASAKLTDLLGTPPEGPKFQVTTLGADGASVLSGDRQYRHPGYTVQVRDTTGAGDAFAAAFLYQHLRQVPLENCLRFANAAAALSTTAYGAQTALATSHEIEQFLKCAS